MASALKKSLRVIPFISERGGKSIARVLLSSFIKEQKRKILKEVAQEYPWFLLWSMDWAFVLLPDFRKNLGDFDGRYVLRTEKGDFEASLIFQNGNLARQRKALNEWDVKITFMNAGDLRAFLFSEDQDMVNAILENKVSIDGNCNYLYKFGFMARTLVKMVCKD